MAEEKATQDTEESRPQPLEDEETKNIVGGTGASHDIHSFQGDDGENTAEMPDWYRGGE